MLDAARRFAMLFIRHLVKDEFEEIMIALRKETDGLNVRNNELEDSLKILLIFWKL